MFSQNFLYTSKFKIRIKAKNFETKRCGNENRRREREREIERERV